MNRRDFLISGLAAGSSALAYGLKPQIQDRVNRVLYDIAQERKDHPLYFDALTFLSGDDADIRRSGLSGFIWDISKGRIEENRYIREINPTLKYMAETLKFLRSNDLGLFLAVKGSSITEAHRNGKTAVIFQSQSAEPFTNDLEMMNVFYEMGLRISQMTHHYGNDFAGGALVKEWTGLTELGYNAIEKMCELGIIPDLSHANEILADDILKTSTIPVIASHTGCRALVNNARCLPDKIIKGIADSGGVVGIFAMSFWLTEENTATNESYIKQIEHVINVGGADAVGISNDYSIAGQPEGVRNNNDNSKVAPLYHPWWKQHEGILGFEKLPEHVFIPDMNNVRRMFVIQKELEKRKYLTTDIEKIMGGNWVRVFTDVLG
ncbi:membrane dipeptidase [candidate division KSB1 bacterium]